MGKRARQDMYPEWYSIFAERAGCSHILVGTGVPDGPRRKKSCFADGYDFCSRENSKKILALFRTVGDCTVQYDYIQVVQDDCIQFCDIIKARK